MRFLRVVPAWGLLAGVLLLHQGDLLLRSRWAPATVALVHLFTLGVVGNAMLGSLLQFLPVVAGLQPRIGRALGTALPIGFNLGIAGLVCGLLAHRALLAPSGVLLASTLGLYAGCALAGLRFDGQQTLLRAGLALALAALLLTAGLGLVLVLALAGWLGVPLTMLTDLHASVAVLGAVLMLLGTVGSVVLPMFQGTRTPARGALLGWMLLLLAALAAAIVLRASVPGGGALAILSLPVSAFALAVLTLQWRAPHRPNPVLVGFWRLGAIGLLGATMAALCTLHWPQSRAAMLAGALALGVALPALVLGMLLEIAAFLTWLQLQTQRSRGLRVPAIEHLLPASKKSRVLALHALAALALAYAAAWPTPFTARAAAVCLIAAYGWTLAELLRLELRGRRRRLRIDAADPAPRPRAGTA